MVNKHGYSRLIVFFLPQAARIPSSHRPFPSAVPGETNVAQTLGPLGGVGPTVSSSSSAVRHPFDTFPADDEFRGTADQIGQGWLRHQGVDFIHMDLTQVM